MLKIFLPLFLLLLLAQKGLAQEDTIKVNQLKIQSLNFAKENRTDPGIKVGLECLTMAQKLKWRKGVAGAYYCLATNFIYRNDYAKALKYTLDQLKLDDAGDKKDLFAGYRNAALIYSELHEYQKSLTYYFSTLKMAESLGDKSEVARIKGNISICYEDLGDYDMAMNYLFEALHADRFVNGAAFDHISTEYPSPPAYEFKVLKVKKELDLLAAEVQLTDDGGHVYKDPSDSMRNRESLMKASIANYFAKKKASAQTDAERQQLKKEEESKQQQLSAYYSQKNAKDSILNQLKEQKAKFIIDSTQKQSNEERARLAAETRQQNQINEANLKSSRTYSYAAATVACLLAVIALISIFAYRQNQRDNMIIKKLVSDQEHIIELRTKELAETNDRLAHANKKLVELVQYNAHRMREPLTRVMGAMAMLEYTTPEEFCQEITPEIKRAVSDLDNSIMQVITLADETIEQYDK